jgi:hypothetical protein
MANIITAECAALSIESKESIYLKKTFIHFVLQSLVQGHYVDLFVSAGIHNRQSHCFGELCRALEVTSILTVAANIGLWYKNVVGERAMTLDTSSTLESN